MQEGLEAVCSDYNGLQELMTRQDAIYELEKYASTLASIRVTSSSFKSTRIKYSVQSGGIEVLLDSFNPKKHSLAAVPYTDGAVYTPKRTKVPTYVGYTWASHGIDGIIADARDDAFQEAYPNATHLREEYPSYNCHSYAWYSTSSTNQHWMISPSAYMSDGSYKSVNASIGCKAYYGKANHSAIVVSVGQVSGPNVGVRSKWGAYGLYAHKILDCPYAKNATVSFWKLN